MNENIKIFLNEQQDEKVVEKIYGKVSELLTAGEEIQYIAVQKKPAVNLSPDCIALTNKRIIFCCPKSFGLSMEFQDYSWKDVIDVHIKEGILGSDFTVKTAKVINKIEYLPKAQARKLYQFGQQREEENRELRRERELEDKRAAAGGGIVVNTNIPSQNNTPIANAEDPMEKLKKLKMMLENDLISQAEFDAKKAEILAAL